MTSIAGLPLRVFQASNPGPFTLDGTRTYVVGQVRPIVIDPGPDEARHVARLVEATAGAEEVRILLTHRHADHAGAARGLAEATGAQVLGTGQTGESRLDHGATVESDDGGVVAVWTPGHCDAHLSFHWPRYEVAFCGDLLLGEGSTTWVAGYPTAVADYLDSLDVLERLKAKLLVPTHGPPLGEPAKALHRFRTHRLERIAQVRAARTREPGASLERVVAMVYGSELPPGMQRPAEASVAAILDYLSQA